MARDFMGGQAVVEGVLMMFRDRYAIAVRSPTGIVTTRRPFPLKRAFWMRIPFIRGIILLFTTLIIGFKAMGWSANASGEEDEQLTGWMLLWAILISLVLALLLFKLAPFFLAYLVIGTEHRVFFNLLDGLLRIAIFIGYLLIVRQFADVKRLFMYHGAEHKVINAWEKTGTLKLQASRSATRLHPRCSTSFVVLVLVIAILVFSLVDLNLPIGWLLLARLGLVLPIAGVSWELIRFAGLHAEHPLVKPFLLPGYWVQEITTSEPDDDQLRVAMAAAKAVLHQDAS